MNSSFLLILSVLLVGSLHTAEANFITDFFKDIFGKGKGGEKANLACTLSCGAYWMCMFKNKAADCKKPDGCICERFVRG